MFNMLHTREPLDGTSSFDDDLKEAPFTIMSHTRGPPYEGAPRPLMFALLYLQHVGSGTPARFKGQKLWEGV
jgi:hypothetical protein